jgi:hypothetical protein
MQRGDDASEDQPAIEPPHEARPANPGKPATRSLDELKLDEYKRLRKEIVSHLQTGEPSQRAIETRYRISRCQVRKLSVDIRERG